jgi:hypothetical protein
VDFLCESLPRNERAVEIEIFHDGSRDVNALFGNPAEIPNFGLAFPADWERFCLNHGNVMRHAVLIMNYLVHTGGSAELTGK